MLIENWFLLLWRLAPGGAGFLCDPVEVAPEPLYGVLLALPLYDEPLCIAVVLLGQLLGADPPGPPCWPGTGLPLGLPGGGGDGLWLGFGAGLGLPVGPGFGSGGGVGLPIGGTGTGGGVGLFMLPCRTIHQLFSASQIRTLRVRVTPGG